MHKLKQRRHFYIPPEHSNTRNLLPTMLKKVPTLAKHLLHTNTMLVAFTYDLSRAFGGRLYSPLTKEKNQDSEDPNPTAGGDHALPTILCFQRALPAFARLPALP